MSDTHNAANITYQDMFVTGIQASGLIFLTRLIGAAIAWFILEQATFEFTIHPLWLIGCTVTIIMLAAMAPLVTRSFPETKILRIPFIVCAIVALMLPYFYISFSSLFGRAFILLYIILPTLPLMFVYFASLIFALGEIFHIEVNEQRLKQWEKTPDARATITVMAYYFALIGSSILCALLFIL